MRGQATQSLRSDAGAGSILSVAIIGAVMALTMMLAPLYIGVVARRSVAGAADAAALAAADTAIGRVPGVPCDAAAVVAGANGASIVSCTVDGLIVSVTAQRTVLGIPVTAAATAGPADATVN
ncbi:MAG: Rv3654c family TadE-like protein [Rhodoglobus sp.]